MRRRVDHHLDEKVAAPTTVEMGDAPSLEAEHPTGLRARGHDHVLGAVESLVAKVGAEGGLGDRQVDDVDQIVAMALEALVGRHSQVDVQIAVAAAARPRRAPARQAQGGAVVDTGGHVDRVGALLGDPPLAAAVTTRAGDLFTSAATARAGGRRHHLTEDRSTDAVHLAAALALVARGGRRARASAGALAGGAGDRLAQANLALGAEGGLFEGQIEGHFHVGALAGASPLAGTPKGRAPEAAAEERLEQVAEAAGERTGIEPRRAAAGDLGTEHVIAAPALGVAQGLVGDGDLLEALLGVGITATGVGVQLAGQLAVGALDLVLSGAGSDAQ